MVGEGVRRTKTDVNQPFWSVPSESVYRGVKPHSRQYCAPPTKVIHVNKRKCGYQVCTELRNTVKDFCAANTWSLFSSTGSWRLETMEIERPPESWLVVFRPKLAKEPRNTEKNDWIPIAVVEPQREYVGVAYYIRERYCTFFLGVKCFLNDRAHLIAQTRRNFILALQSRWFVYFRPRYCSSGTTLFVFRPKFSFWVSSSRKNLRKNMMHLYLKVDLYLKVACVRITFFFIVRTETPSHWFIFHSDIFFLSSSVGGVFSLCRVPLPPHLTAHTAYEGRFASEPAWWSWTLQRRGWLWGWWSSTASGQFLWRGSRVPSRSTLPFGRLRPRCVMMAFSEAKKKKTSRDLNPFLELHCTKKLFFSV